MDTLAKLFLITPELVLTKPPVVPVALPLDMLTPTSRIKPDELLNKPIGFELLPDKFTLSQMQKLYEVILGTTFDKRNFRKKISSMKYLIPLNEKQVGVAHKPARLYIFSREVYTKTKKDNFIK